METNLITHQQIATILSRHTTRTHLNNTMSTNVNWDNIVMEGSKNLVLPAIYTNLKTKDALQILPKDLEVYLSEITQINRNRNRAILKQATDISAILNAHNIKHVFLKGTAMLVLNHYNDLAERMVGDIDILVEKQKLITAFNLIKANGYSKTLGFAYHNPQHRHLERLIPDKELAAIELHAQLLAKKNQHHINVNHVLQTREIREGMAIPNPYYRALHNVCNWQLNDHGHYYGEINHRTLYDSLMLNTPKNETLITHLYTTNFGQSFLELAKIYYPDYTEIVSHPKMKCYRKQHLLKLKSKYIKATSKFLKVFYFENRERIILVINNKSYRKHLFKMIFSKKKNTIN
ncbi:nucleotidyltransferase family protein [Lacinutrix undariae]